MRREPPDSHFYAEVRELNLAFLALIVEATRGWSATPFGLDPAIAHEIGRLHIAQLEAVAATPCLLAGFALRRPLHSLAMVAEPRSGTDPAWCARARMYAADLWNYAWQMTRRDPLRAALCVDAARAAVIGAMSFREMRSAGEQALHYLEARFRGARLWPDLVRAAREGHPEHLRWSRMSAIQLATGDGNRERLASAVPGDLSLLAVRQ